MHVIKCLGPRVYICTLDHAFSLAPLELASLASSHSIELATLARRGPKSGFGVWGGGRVGGALARRGAARERGGVWGAERSARRPLALRAYGLAHPTNSRHCRSFATLVLWLVVGLVL